MSLFWSEIKYCMTPQKRSTSTADLEKEPNEVFNFLRRYRCVEYYVIIEGGLIEIFLFEFVPGIPMN
jgi:hypothetical protein